MKNKITITMIVLIGLVLVSGCTSEEQESTNVTSTTETVCSNNEDICTLGTPGLLNEESIYSGSESVFSMTLRNNLEGQEANNVKVKLENVGPFSIVEGYENAHEKDGVCKTSEGVWKPHNERTIFRSPNPQFIDDIGKPFAVHFLETMYPNEEVEFLWTLKAPSFQEIANVAYDHKFDYVVSYDYRASLLQTVYAMSEQEYQRELSETGQEPSMTGTVTGSVGALDIESQVEEPVRIYDNQSQFSMVYKVYNKRNGIPEKPAMFLLEYPEGTDHVGAFTGAKSLEQYGYLDLNQAVSYYNDTLGLQGGVCIPEDFDVYSDVLNAAKQDTLWKTGLEGTTKLCSGEFVGVTLSEVFAYIRETYPDLEFNEYNPRLVIKFLYPVDLLDEVNYLYYQMKSTEDVDISKYYTFRLKTKYRYSFSGSDEIMVVPNPASFDTSETTGGTGFLWGNMAPHPEYLADSYDLNGQNLSMTRENVETTCFREDEGGVEENTDITVDSTVRDLGNYNFLHLVGLTRADSGGDPCYYSVSVGYNIMEQHVSEVLNTGEGEYALEEGESVYLFNEYPYLDKSSIDRTYNNDPENHNISKALEDTSTEAEALEAINTFISNRSFIEVENRGNIIFSDSDKTGYLIDYPTYGSEGSDVPANLRVLSYSENETLFTESVVDDNELIGVYSSPVTEGLNNRLLLYYFNEDDENHYINYTIKASNATEAYGGGSTIPDAQEIISIYSSSNDWSNNKAPANGVLKQDWNIDCTNCRTMDCHDNKEGVKPILVIEYSDVTIDDVSGEYESTRDSGRIIIGNYTNNPLDEEEGDKFVKGVVNVCYEYEGD